MCLVDQRSRLRFPGRSRDPRGDHYTYGLRENERQTPDEQQQDPRLQLSFHDSDFHLISVGDRSGRLRVLANRKSSRLFSIDARVKEEVASSSEDLPETSVGKVVPYPVLAEQLGVTEKSPWPQNSSSLFQCLWIPFELPVFLLEMV